MMGLRSISSDPRSRRGGAGLALLLLLGLLSGGEACRDASGSADEPWRIRWAVGSEVDRARCETHERDLAAIWGPKGHRFSRQEKILEVPGEYAITTDLRALGLLARRLALPPREREVVVVLLPWIVHPDHLGSGAPVAGLTLTPEGVAALPSAARDELALPERFTPTILLADRVVGDPGPDGGLHTLAHEWGHVLGHRHTDHQTGAEDLMAPAGSRPAPREPLSMGRGAR